MKHRFLICLFLCLFFAASAFGGIGTYVSWNTFQGTTASSVYGKAVVTDAQGYIYIAGSSFATWGTPVNPLNGYIDVYIAKFAPWGELVWNTFLGCGGRDVAKGIALDGVGNVYVIGGSESSWGVPVRPFSGSESVFVAKLNRLGQRLWHTFLNGEGSSEGGGIAVDRVKGNVFVCGTSYAKWGSPVNRFKGPGAFIARLDSNGALRWNTFAPEGSYGLGIALQGGNVFLTGYSNKAWLGALKRFAGGWDAFVFKLDAFGIRQWSTFMGSADEDTGCSIAVNDTGEIFVAGTSKASWGSPGRAFSGGGKDAFVARLSPVGVPRWNTFLGSSDWDEASSIGLNNSGNIYIAGFSNASWGTPFRAYSGPDTSDTFAAKLAPDGTLLWNGFLGGTGFSTVGNGISVSPIGDIVVTGDGYGSWGAPVNPFAGTWSNMYAAAIREPGIAVSAPAANESLSRGMYYDIEWTSLVPYSEVAIDLMKGNNMVLPIVTSTDDDGEYMAQIPRDFLPGTGFRFRVRTLDGAYAGLSAAFSIDKGSFYFFSPSGGDVWKRRTTAFISWDIAGNPGPSVRLYLCNPKGRYLSTISNRTLNGGSYSWAIRGSQPPGAYRIKILTLDGSVSALSGLFTID